MSKKKNFTGCQIPKKPGEVKTMLYSAEAHKEICEYAKNESFSKDYLNYFKQIETKCTELNSENIPALFHPIILTQDTLSKISQQSEQINKILNKTIKLYKNNSEVKAYFNLPDPLDDWMNIDPNYDIQIPISRYDGFWDGENYKPCEFNTDGTSGMNEVNVLDEIFLNTDMGKYLKNIFSLKNYNLGQSILDTILAAYKNFGGKGTPNIAITDFLDLGTMSEFKTLRKCFMSKGYSTEICDIRHLKYRNGSLWHNDFRVDLIYRRAVTDEMFPRKDDIKNFLKAYKENAVCVVGPLCSHIAHTKIVLTFLSSPLAENYFTDKEIKFIKNHIPWTRLLIDHPVFIADIISNKNNYFLKPHNAHGGQGVYAGEEHDTESFTNIINQILENKQQAYLVQKKIPLPTDYFISDDKGNLKEHNVTVGSYVLNNKFAGIYARVSTGTIITTPRGALVAPVFAGKLEH
jgi:hypothetical protein